MFLLPLLNKYDVSVELMVVLDQLLLNEVEGRLALLVKLSLFLILRHHVQVVGLHLAYVVLVFLEGADEGAHLHLECLLHACVHFKFYKVAYSTYVQIRNVIRFISLIELSSIYYKSLREGRRAFQAKADVWLGYDGYNIIAMSFIQEQVDIDLILNKLLDKQWSSQKLEQRQIRTVCMKSRELLLQQPMLLELQAPVKICGDIHGQYSDLLKVFEYGGYPGDSNYLFIGDYVDRGKNSIECIMLLLCYKLRFPENFFLLRGNHENSSINRIYGFYDECKRRYNLKIWKYFLDVFNVMPICAVIDEKIICMHGGLSPDLQNLADIISIKRPIEVPDQGLLCDLLWSDPNPDIKGWGQNQRGISYTFGQDVVQKFLKDFNIDLVCRAHQVVEEGYEFNWNRKLVTIFTAPNYCGQFQNNGAFMNVDEHLVCSFQILKAYKKPK